MVIYIYLQDEGLLAFACHKIVSMATFYQLKIKYDRDKFGVVFLTHIQRDRLISIEDKREST